jgi:hypothetical protein
VLSVSGFAPGVGVMQALKNVRSYKTPSRDDDECPNTTSCIITGCAADSDGGSHFCHQFLQISSCCVVVLT